MAVWFSRFLTTALMAPSVGPPAAAGASPPGLVLPRYFGAGRSIPAPGRGPLAPSAAVESGLIGAGSSPPVTGGGTNEGRAGARGGLLRSTLRVDGPIDAPRWGVT